MKKPILAAAISVVAVLSFAASAQARHRSGATCVQVLKSKDVTMEKGRAHVFVVNMNGHMMVAIPADMVPDPLHQQLFTVEGQ